MKKPYKIEDQRIMQLRESERPREKLSSEGERRLTDAELLAIVLRTGRQGQSALAMARELLDRFGDLRRLAACSVKELSTIKGIGLAKAAQVKAALELSRRVAETPVRAGMAISMPGQVHDHYCRKLRGEKKEYFYAVLLDSGNRIIKDVQISVGGLSASLVDMRAAFTEAIRESAASVIFIHNHPSGNHSPSQEDIEVTKKLKATSEVIGISILDHLVVSDDGYTSFSDAGLL